MFEEISDFWKNENLVKAEPTIIKDTEISEESKKFLLDVGLPKNFNLMLEFDLTFSQINGCYKIGSDGNNSVCICDEEIIVFDENEGLSKTFINSSVIHLAKCLISYQEILNSIDDFDYSEEESERLADFLTKSITKIDKRALEDEESWWSLIIEQTEQGLL